MCCGSRFTQIRIHLAVLDPDLYWERGSGSRSMEIDQNFQIDLVSSLSKLQYLCRYVFWSITSFTYISHVRIQLLETWKFDQDPDPHWFRSLDPDPHWNQSRGSTTLVTYLVLILTSAGRSREVPWVSSESGISASRWRSSFSSGRTVSAQKQNYYFFSALNFLLCLFLSAVIN